ncbi:amino acid ABC transporter permease [Lichenifustis flavocetrariae]|uniref:Amino acid ABC transporter permease n=1 Tax=Lichenifustis flavocetrariae TaxID=2949735 RepID=A0AA41Z7A9_9HYPH|nr:amino acid ABC transporter permease [Lichenifustis flavocetrariae]MCW6511813.1 amino acid ABC transporter permease [Lichenifustis flavocetrariae]
MDFDTTAFATALPKLVAASGVSLGIALLAMSLAIGGGFMLTVLRALKWPPLSAIVAVARSIIFGTPLLVLILIAYYVLPAIGLNLTPVTAGTLAIGTSSAFFVSEIFRGGLATIPAGQVEAAASLSLGAPCIWLRVLLPQVLRVSVPALVNEFTILFKATALLSAITVTDVLRTAQQIYAVNYRPFETLLAAACIYVAINLIASRFGSLAERRNARFVR